MKKEKQVCLCYLYVAIILPLTRIPIVLQILGVPCFSLKFCLYIFTSKVLKTLNTL